MAKFTLGLANADNEDDVIVLKIAGSDDWVKELIPCIHGFIESIRANAPFDLTNEAEVEEELRAAFAATEKGETYTSKVIHTAILAAA